MDRRTEQMRELNKTSVLIAAALFAIIPLLGFVLWIMLQDTAAEDLSSLSEMLSIVVVMGAIVVATIPLWAIHFPRFSRWERLLEAEQDRFLSAPQMVG